MPRVVLGLSADSGAAIECFEIHRPIEVFRQFRFGSLPVGKVYVLEVRAQLVTSFGDTYASDARPEAPWTDVIPGKVQAAIDAYLERAKFQVEAALALR